MAGDVAEYREVLRMLSIDTVVLEEVEVQEGFIFEKQEQAASPASVKGEVKAKEAESERKRKKADESRRKKQAARTVSCLLLLRANFLEFDSFSPPPALPNRD